jgi:hypothetical protein
MLARHSTRPGHRRLGLALEQYEHGDGGAASVLEDDIAAPILAIVDGKVELNRLRLFGGKPMKPDIYLSDVAIAIEINAMHGHSRPTRVREDGKRAAAYRADGITPFFIRDTHVDRDRDAAIHEILKRQSMGAARAAIRTKPA